MKSRLFCLAGLWISLAHAANAQCSGVNNLDQIVGDTRAEFEATAAAIPYGQGRYWEVIRHGKRSVLIGTYHLPDPRTAIVSGAMAQEIDRASLLLIEVTSAEEKRMQEEIKNNPMRVLNLDGTKLHDVLSAEEWQILSDRGEAVGIPPVSLNIMQPWFVGISLAMPPCALASTKSGKLGLDKLIEARAKVAGVPVNGLETFDELFALFAEGSFEKQVADLKLGLSMGASTPDDFETMIELYLNDEIGKIWAITDWKLRRALPPEAAAKALAEAFDALIVRRNQNWLDTLLPALEEGNAVVAVGALHLGSDAGLLAILEREGYSINRLSLAP